MQRFTVNVSRGTHSGVIIRLPRVGVYDLLRDWNAWKQLLSRTDIDDWLLGHMDINMSAVQVMADNGLGESGKCPYHGVQHLQVFPLNSEPMKCSEAVKMKEEGKA